MTTHHIVVTEENARKRLDKLLADHFEEFSRARLQSIIKDGHVYINDKKQTKTSEKINEDDTITVTIPEVTPATIEAQNIPLDILYEDDDVLIINKQAGLVVHPGTGNWDGTLVNALLHHCGDTLSGIGGVMRPGIVHRLDKDTTGVMIAAKNDHAHQHLSQQLQDRTLSRIYQTFVLGAPFPPKGHVDAPIGRDSKNRLKMTTNASKSRTAKTFYTIEKTYADAVSLMKCRLETGRTHQIRVHMNALKHPVIGDPLYGPQPTALTSILKKNGYTPDQITEISSLKRQALHAWQLSFTHPKTEETLTFEAPTPPDLIDLKEILEKPGDCDK